MSLKEIWDKDIKPVPKASLLKKLGLATEIGVLIGAGKFAIEGGLIALLSVVTPFALAFLGAGLLTAGALAGTRKVIEIAKNNREKKPKN